MLASVTLFSLDSNTTQYFILFSNSESKVIQWFFNHFCCGTFVKNALSDDFQTREL